jgi:hypothetical protein
MKVVQDCFAAYFQPSPFDKLRAGSTGLNSQNPGCHTCSLASEVRLSPIVCGELRTERDDFAL